MRFRIHCTHGGSVKEDYPHFKNVTVEDGVELVEVATLEDLVEMANTAGEPLILSTEYDARSGNSDMPSIEVYNDYRE